MSNMQLPKLSAPEYELTLPSCGKVVTFRPFLVKEEKILLMAMEGEDKSEMMRSIRQIIENCCLTEGLEIDKLPFFDIEYFFIQLRAKSIDDTIKFKYKFDEETTIPVTLNLNDVKINRQVEKEEFDILLSEKPTIGMFMKYPSLEVLMKMSKDPTLSEDANGNVNPKVSQQFSMIADCIESIYDGKNIYKREEHSLEEINDFLESLNDKQFKKIEKFFKEMPKLSHDIVVTHPKTKEEKTIHLEGLENFFNLG